MDITLNKNSTTDAVIKVTLSEPDYQSRISEKLKEYSKTANIKGFRPGKVPSSLIKKMYGKAIKAEEISKLLSEKLQEYLKESDLKFIGDPLPSDQQGEIDWDNQLDFEFLFDIGLSSEFEVPADIEVENYDVEISEKELEEIYEDLKARYGENQEVENVKEGDVISASLKGTNIEEERKVVLFTEKLEKKSKKLFEGKVIEDTVVADIEKLFTEKDDLKQFLNVEDEELEKYSGEYEIKISKISRNTPAEPNQEFFDKVFGKDKVTTEEEFKSEYRRILNENLKKEAEHKLAADIEKKMIESVNIEIPVDFYKRWVLRSNEISEEEYDKHSEFYIKDLKWSLIKGKIQDEQSIEIKFEEVLDATKKMFLQQFGLSEGLTPEIEQSLNGFATDYLQRDNGKNYYQVYSNLRNEKIIGLLKEKVKLIDKKITRKEFEEIIRN
ncbi:MAG: trigger factor [Cyclobacteriaceae bacterium]|nr:trigger factor [Cyclobacteriaceae bacterium]